MPCCAFAACIVGQLLFVLRAFKGALLGGAQATPRNDAVEWRLDFDDRPQLAARPGWLSSRRAIGGLAVAATVELLLVLGAVYGIVEHFGHGSAGHAAHVHSASGAAHAEAQEVQP